MAKRAAQLDPATHEVTNVLVIEDNQDPIRFGAVLCPEDVSVGWVRDPNTGEWSDPSPPPEPPPLQVPQEVTPAQARAALYRAGLLPQVEALVAQTGGEVAIWYEYALSWRRDNPNLLALSAAMGLTPADVDGLFVTAAGIDQ